MCKINIKKIVGNASPDVKGTLMKKGNLFFFCIAEELLLIIPVAAACRLQSDIYYIFKTCCME